MSSKKTKSRYRRVILKLSGETLQNPKLGQGLDAERVYLTATRIKAAQALGAEIGVVIGGGNIFRGSAGAKRGIERHTGDYMGMLATIINALALQDALAKLKVEARVMTPFALPAVAEQIDRRRALCHLQQKKVVIFAGGTGSPFFTTDSGAALRAAEIKADALLKATKVDGVYSADPLKNPTARRFNKITFQQALADSLQIMDAAAFALCMENNIPIIVFDFFKQGNMEKALLGRQVGTLVCN